MHKFDVFVIGTGTASGAATGILQSAGLSVAVGSELPVGGTCALKGCQPKKYLVIPAHAVLEAGRLTGRGLISAPRLGWKEMHEAQKGFTDPIPESTKEGYRKQGIHLFEGTCRFLSPNEIQCGDQTIGADYFIIAAGAQPRPLPIPGGDLAVTSDDFLELSELPRHITFIGGGFISMEFSHTAAAAGSETVIIQRGNRILNRFDHDMADIVTEASRERGIDIRTEISPVRIGRRKDSFIVETDDGKSIETDLVVAAIGRIPNTELLNLENAGVAYSKGGIITDKEMRTNTPNIYAIGDCVEGIQLSPVSDVQGRTAARNIIGPGSEAADLSTLPSVVFTYPQLASVGMTADSVQKLNTGGGETIRTVQGSAAGWPNYRRLNETHAGYKVFINSEKNIITGAHLAGPYAGEMINLFALAIELEVPVDKIKELPWAYPTYTSDIKYMLG